MFRCFESHDRISITALTLIYSVSNDETRVIGWLEFNVLFSTNTAISETKGQGWRVILLPSEGRLAIY